MSGLTESYIEILNLVYSYPELLDGGDLVGVGELFRDATLVFEGPDGTPLAELSGSDAVRANFEASVKIYPDDGTPHTRHVLTNPIVDIEEDAGTAVCRYYCTVFQRTDDFPLQPVWANRYEDQLRRVDGAWRLVHRRGFGHMPGDTSQHLTF
jgi:hypothetical protein